MRYLCHQDCMTVDFPGGCLLFSLNALFWPQDQSSTTTGTCRPLLILVVVYVDALYMTEYMDKLDSFDAKDRKWLEVKCE